MKNKYNIPICFLFIMSLFINSPITAQESKEIKGITNKSYLEFANNVTGSIMPSSYNCDIFYFNEWILYKIPVYKMLSKEQSDGSFQMELTDSVDYHQYLVYRQSAKHGFFFDQDLAPNGDKVLVDSILENISYLPQEMFSNTNRCLISTTESPDGNTVKEIYVPKFKKDDTFPDSTYFYFSRNFIDVDFSFSKKLEAERGLKLIKVEMVYNAMPKGAKYNFDVSRRVLRFEIEPLVITDKEYIFKYFKKAQSFKE